VRLKEILKLVGVGATGALLALKIRKPSRRYDEFVRVYETISLEFRHQFETVILQTMLPAVREADRNALCGLLDRQASFPEQLRFFHDHLDDFDERVVQSFERLYRLRSEGSIAPTARRRLAGDAECYYIGVDEVFYDLEKAFIEEIAGRLDAEERRRVLSGDKGFLTILREARGLLPDFSVAFFEGLARFQEMLAHPLGR
jgi:hypothetical protein